MNINRVAKTIVFAVVASSFSTAALAEPSVEELAERLERMQQEMDQLKQQLKNSATKEEVQVIKKDVFSIFPGPQVLKIDDFAHESIVTTQSR